MTCLFKIYDVYVRAQNSTKLTEKVKSPYIGLGFSLAVAKLANAMTIKMSATGESLNCI